MAVKRSAVPVKPNPATKGSSPAPKWLGIAQMVSGMGILPEGHRTQILAVVVAAGTVVATVMEWSTGDLTIENLWVVVQGYWVYYAGALGLNFLGDKVDKSD